MARLERGRDRPLPAIHFRAGAFQGKVERAKINPFGAGAMPHGKPPADLTVAVRRDSCRWALTVSD
jgi:hypothetical protein